MHLDRSLRAAVLQLAAIPQLRHWVEETGWKFGVRRFVAGTELCEALQAASHLRDAGFKVTLDLLGESVNDADHAKAAAAAIQEMLTQLHLAGSEAHVSIKLTQLGLLLDPELCRNQMISLLQTARSNGQFIRIDMEDSMVTGQTLALFSELHEQFGAKHVGIVVQSYLYRTPEDIQHLIDIGASVRVVKGAYLEPESVAYPDKADVDRAYLQLVTTLLDAGNYTAIATHDRTIIADLIRYIADQDIPKDRFEFQMLFGIATELQKQLVNDGYRVRIYTPFGTHWYPYFSRRLAERPANIWFVLRHLWPHQ